MRRREMVLETVEGGGVWDAFRIEVLIDGCWHERIHAFDRLTQFEPDNRSDIICQWLCERDDESLGLQP